MFKRMIVAALCMAALSSLSCKAFDNDKKKSIIGSTGMAALGACAYNRVLYNRPFEKIKPDCCGFKFSDNLLGTRHPADHPRMFNYDLKNVYIRRDILPWSSMLKGSAIMYAGVGYTIGIAQQVVEPRFGWGIPHEVGYGFGNTIMAATCASCIPSSLWQLKHVLPENKEVIMRRVKTNMFGTVGFGLLAMYNALTLSE